MTQFAVQAADAGRRLDVFLQEKFPEHSRSRIQAWIKEGCVTVNGTSAKASLVLRGGETVEAAPVASPPLQAAAEDLPVEILYEDSAVVAVNKPAGLVVHAGAGVESGTLVNRLVSHFQTLSQVGGELRPGIVHRLDKGTSGVLLVARNDAAHRDLAAQFSGRTVEKDYLALVQGRVRDATGRIDKPIARDPAHRTRMTARLETGRSALTSYRVLERFEGTDARASPSPGAMGKFTYLEVRLGTGRTHQIRVHLASIGHPVAGDRLYGAHPRDEAPRIFLHAARISFSSPASGERVTVQAPLPQDLEQWLASLRELRS